jgi:ribonuclease BN (tRNA processing enzyme)
LRLAVLSGWGAWPAKDEGCSGYLLEHNNFRLPIDPGYATLPTLLRYTKAEGIDAVLVSHGHPDHCADLNPLLRSRALQSKNSLRLPVYSLSGALDAVLALDRTGMLQGNWLSV